MICGEAALDMSSARPRLAALCDGGEAALWARVIIHFRSSNSTSSAPLNGVLVRGDFDL